MPKRISIWILLLLGLALAIGGSLAYYSSEIKVVNLVTAGNVTVELLTSRIDEEGREGPCPETVPVVPGTQQSRIVRVRNTGSAAAWVRIGAEIEFALDPDAQGRGEPDERLVHFVGLDPSLWIRQDGYWYYSKPLEPDETAPALFTALAFDPGMNDLYQNSSITVTLHLEATQLAHNGEKALEAAGWPES